jgi:hypothetical protein
MMNKVFQRARQNNLALRPQHEPCFLFLETDTPSRCFHLSHGFLIANLPGTDLAAQCSRGHSLGDHRGFGRLGLASKTGA